MNNFIFQNPTTLIFGKGMISKLSKRVPKGAKVMMTYGGGSIKTNGVYDQVKAALEGFDVIEFGGIEANPDYDTLMKAVEICKAEKVDFLLAVGGGSIIDGTKFISLAITCTFEPWNFVLDESKANFKGVDFASVLTLPATASEMNNGSVISKRRTDEKFPFHSPYTYPKFSILDPEVVYSLPKKQIANGIVDTFIHTVEQYMTYPSNSLVMDRWAEGLLQTLVELAPKLMAEEKDYDAAANFMLTATMGLNGFIAMGVPQDWATHMIGHELTALVGVDHGQSLAIVYPALLRVLKEQKKAKLVQYAARVWNITEACTDGEIADKAIVATEEFFKSLGMKMTLAEYGAGDEVKTEVVSRFAARGWSLGEKGNVNSEIVSQILALV